MSLCGSPFLAHTRRSRELPMPIAYNVFTRAAESESTGVGSFDRSLSRSRSRQIFIDSDSGPESESVTGVCHNFFAIQDGNRDRDISLRADCRQLMVCRVLVSYRWGCVCSRVN